MDHSELGEPFNGFKFKFLEPKEHAKALELMEKFLYDTMTPLGSNGEHPEDWNNLFKWMMTNERNLNYVAVHIESGEIAACRMVDVIIKDEPHDPPPFQHKTNSDVLKLCEEVCKDENLFEKYGITKYADMFGLVVDPKYRQMGLATEMYTRGLRLLKNRGFEIVKCGFISPYSRKAGLKHGYEEFARRYFQDCKDEEGNVLNADADPNDFICFGVFNLRKIKIGDMNCE